MQQTVAFLAPKCPNVWYDHCIPLDTGVGRISLKRVVGMNIDFIKICDGSILFLITFPSLKETCFFFFTNIKEMSVMGFGQNPKKKQR